MSIFAGFFVITTLLFSVVTCERATKVLVFKEKVLYAVMSVTFLLVGLMFMVAL